MRVGGLAQTAGSPPHAAIFAANLALELDPQNAKALYRRAMGHVAEDTSTSLELAARDLERAVRLAPDDKGLRAAFRKHAGEHQKQKEKDQQTYGGMLSASPSARVCPGVRVASHRLASPRIGLTPEETPLPSNSPHDHMILRVDLHGRWKRPCLQTAHMTI